MKRLDSIKQAEKEVTVHLHGVTVTTTVPKREYDLFAGKRLLDRVHRQAEGCHCGTPCKECHCH